MAKHTPHKARTPKGAERFFRAVPGERIQDAAARAVADSARAPMFAFGTTAVDILPGDTAEALLARYAAEASKIGMVKVLGCLCRCGHRWLPRSPSRRPAVCPKCKSAAWDRPRRNRIAAAPARAGGGLSDTSHREGRIA